MPAREQRGQGGVDGRVNTPGQAVWDDERVEPPLAELLEELVRQGCVLAAVMRQLARVDAGGAVRHAGDLGKQAEEVGIGAEADHAQQLGRPEKPAWRRTTKHAGRQRRDRPRGQRLVRQPAEDDVLVAEVRLRRGAGLRPLPADECDEVGVLRIAGARIALADALFRFLPARRRQALGMIVQREEVERGAVAGEVAGVRRRVHPFAAEERQRVQERVDRVGGVDVEVAPQDRLGGRRARVFSCADHERQDEEHDGGTAARHGCAP